MLLSKQRLISCSQAFGIKRPVTRERENVVNFEHRPLLLPFKSPQHNTSPPCQFWFAFCFAATMAEVPVLCAAVRLGSDTGQRDQSYANGNQMGRESPVDYRRRRRRREACVFLCSPGTPIFLSSLSNRKRNNPVCCSHVGSVCPCLFGFAP